MSRSVAFDDLLDEKLAAESIDPTPAATFGPAGMATAYGFFFVDVPRTAVAASAAARERRVGRVDWAGWTADSESVTVDQRFAGAVTADTVRVRVHASAPPTAAPAVPRRPRRVLSVREQRALADLVALGTTLDSDFSFDELRSAFRTLARRYHPDRHTGCNEQDKARLAAQFTRARDAYKILASHFTRVN
jgi:hypothetical protein